MPTFSSHAPTGSTQKFVVSPNQYSDAGRNIGYPTKYSVYVNKISEADGSTTVTEVREVSELVGNRLYLWHRPVTLPNGTPTTITIGGGGSPVLDTGSTNAKSAYIVFSTLPTSQFTVTYLAAPDCLHAWNLNTLQDDVMEMQKSLGVTNLTGSPGLRNLAYATFDIPNDANYSGVAPRAVYLSHLAQNIVIGSTNDPSLSPSLGSSHTIQIGRSTDAVLIDTTGLHVVQSDGSKTTNITLGNRTGDYLTWAGQVSGQGPLTIGGPAWQGYSGVVFSPEFTETFYTGAMLRVHGDVAVAGGVRSIGPLIVVTTTGTTSIVLGDWTVQDELFVYGTTHLNGETETNNLRVRYDLFVDGNVFLTNETAGPGGAVIDNLDPSEVAHSYNTLIKKRISNCVIDGSHVTREVDPKLNVYAPHYRLGASGLVGDVFTVTGRLDGSVASSGAHPAIFQVSLDVPVVHGTFTGLIKWTGDLSASINPTGQYTGVWCPGLMNPGSLWMRVTNGQGRGFTAPIYNYDIRQANTMGIQQMRVYCPEQNILDPGLVPTTSDSVMLYNPGSVPYNFLSAVGGASPTYQVSGSSEFPFKVAFDDEVRIMRTSTTNLSLLEALEKSISGMPSTQPTGTAYIFASALYTDPENPPIFKARPVGMRMPNEAPVGEVTAYKAGGTWTILDTVSYRPNGVYDSAWMPIVSGCAQGLNSGRFIPALNASSNTFYKYFFQHNLGPNLDLAHLNAELYLASMPSYPRALTGNLNGFNQVHTDLHGFNGVDHNAGFGPDGRFLRVPLHSSRTSSSAADVRDASIFYIDSRVVGVNIAPGLIYDLPTGYSVANTKGKPYQYMRVALRRDV